MRYFSPTRSAVIAVLTVVVFVLVHSRVQAGCGDYITIRNDKSSAVDVSGHAIFKPVGTSKPCHGPHCSAQQSPSSPPIAPPATVVVPVGEQAILSSMFARSVNEMFQRIPLSIEGTPIHTSSLPFHPPKACR